MADTRSFMSAAQILYISRQAISKAISQLEEELQVELFMRHSNGAFLTPAGIVFYDRIRPIIFELEKVTNEMKHSSPQYQQCLRLAFSIGTLQLFEKKLLAFCNNRKNIKIEYVECPETDCVSQIIDNKADVIICTEQATDPSIYVEEILRSRYGILIQNQPPLNHLESAELSELSWLPLAGVTDTQTAKQFGPLSYSGYDYRRLFSLVQQGLCALLLPEALAVTRDEATFRWLPLKEEKWWHVYFVHLQTLERNILYRTVLDELQMEVFEMDEHDKGNTYD